LLTAASLGGALLVQGKNTTVFNYICFFILLFILVSWAWPDPRIKQRDDDRRHAETLAAIASAARQNAAPVAPTVPKYDAAYRAHVLALGRIRDRENGVNRHPVLDSERTRVPDTDERTSITGTVYNQPAPVSILQSGVIDGMPYTLYTDGSIEAVLPQGTLRFGSINELQNYVDQRA
jgi:hypothetical protein